MWPAYVITTEHEEGVASNLITTEHEEGVASNLTSSFHPSNLRTLPFVQPIDEAVSLAAYNRSQDQALRAQQC